MMPSMARGVSPASSMAFMAAFSWMPSWLMPEPGLRTYFVSPIPTMQA